MTHSTPGEPAPRRRPPGATAAAPARAAVLLLSAVSLLSAPGAAAQAPPGAADGRHAGDIPFTEYALENGLHVILSPDPEATAVAVNLWYAVGSRDERPGRSGFAHLFEHLMFGGSENLEQGEHSRLVERAGGSLNASITEDRTNYFQTLPPARVNLALWLEAERMRTLRIDEETLRREVEVVKEERRLRVDNAPYGTTQLQAAFYAAYDSASCFPYAHSVIGAMDDLNAAELPDVQEFFDLHYSPNRATLTVVGAFDEPVVRELIDRWFAPIERGPDPPEPRCEAPFSRLPVELDVPDPNATLPGVWVSYGTVERSHSDAAALEVLARILGAGQSSRLHQRLVRGEQEALDVAAFSTTRLGPGLFQLLAISNQGVEPERLLELLDDEIGRVIQGGVTNDEVERARIQVRSSTILGRQTVMGRAEALQSARHFYGTPAAVRTAIEEIEAVEADDVQRVASTYLTPDNRAVIYTRPGGAPGAGEDR